MTNQPLPPREARPLYRHLCAKNTRESDPTGLQVIEVSGKPAIPGRAHLFDVVDTGEHANPAIIENGELLSKLLLRNVGRARHCGTLGHGAYHMEYTALSNGVRNSAEPHSGTLSPRLRSLLDDL